NAGDMATRREGIAASLPSRPPSNSPGPMAPAVTPAAFPRQRLVARTWARESRDRHLPRGDGREMPAGRAYWLEVARPPAARPESHREAELEVSRAHLQERRFQGRAGRAKGPGQQHASP